MKRKFDDLRANLEEFVQQTDYSLLVVGCRPEDCAYVSAFLDGIDAASQESYFLVYPGPFLSAPAYLSDLVLYTQQQLELAAPLRAERGQPAFPPLPAQLQDAKLDPVSRFQAWLRYLTSLLDDAEAQSVVVGLLPGRCDDVESYARLIASVLHESQRPEWLEPLRVVGFDPLDRPRLLPYLKERRISSVLTWQVDFSPSALNDALARDAANPSLPVAERMAALLQLAGIDVAHQRHAAAQQKYAVLFDYYGNPPQPAMQAVCLASASESLILTGDLASAKLLLAKAMGLCTHHNVIPPMVQLMHTSMRLSFSLSEYPEAESYADSGGKLAAATLNPTMYAHFVEKKGDAQLAQHKYEAAIASFEHARKLAEAYGLFDVWLPVLDKGARLQRAAGREQEARELEQESRRVAALEQAARTGESAPHSGVAA